MNPETPLRRRALVVGGYGLIGGYVMARLSRDGWEAVGAGRNVAAARRRFAHARWVELDLARASAADWTAALWGVQAVVNCAGALQDGGRDDLQAVHADGVARLLEACRAAGVSRFVQVSAAGVEPGRPTAFNATKAAGEELVGASGLEWTILRPGLVLAPSAFGGTALLRGLAGFPLVVPAADPDAMVQVIGIDDVAEAVARSLQPGAASGVTADMVTVEAVPLHQVLAALRAWLGFRPAPVVTLPGPLATIASKVADGLALLGWRSPMRATTLAQLRLGVRGDPSTAAACLGIAPRSLEQTLAAWPSGVQDRWFARVYFLKPLLLAVLAAFWAGSGIVALLDGGGHAASVLTVAGITPSLAKAVAVGGAVIDIALGLAVCVRGVAAKALAGMVAVTAAYLAAATVLRPDLWLDPLGPLIKAIPGAVLALVALALMDER